MSSIEPSDYYATAYRNYAAQNPPCKLSFYRSLLPRGGRVLDMGCAFGGFLKSLGPEWDGYGFDPRATYQQGVKSVVADATAIPFRGPFDAITAFDVLEHVPDLDVVGEYLRSELRGTFVMVVPVYDGPLGPVVHVLDHDVTHIHKQSRDWWLRWASKYLNVVDWMGVFRYLVGGYYIHWTTNNLRGIAPAIAIAGMTT